MNSPPIDFQKEEGLTFSVKDKAAITQWIRKVIKLEGKSCGQLQYFFCTDKYLLKINKDFLKHTTYTDIITFDYSAGNEVAGEIYISIERVKENAATYKQAFNRELMRTIIHGVLHLCGYADKTPSAKLEMRKKEDQALELFYGK